MDDREVTMSLLVVGGGARMWVGYLRNERMCSEIAVFNYNFI